MQAIIQKIEQWAEEAIVETVPIGGGSIAQTSLLKFESGKEKFLKTGYEGSMFRKEANGLTEINKSGGISAPKVLLVENDFLLLERINSGNKTGQFFFQFGKQLAKMHQYRSNSFGFYEDNFIGRTPQHNIATTKEKNNWALFYWNKRLLPQLNLARENGYANAEFSNLWSILEECTFILLEEHSTIPSLLHGDLWGGNYLVGTNGQPILIDPAVYYGDRESDLAMTKLFGGFSAEFYEGYQAEFPLEKGWESREPLYKLYHILNHLNLFGEGYFYESIHLMKQCIATK